MQRKFGLDLMRAIAIMLVIYVHTPLSLWGHAGAVTLSVDLFFALSGFLIAQMVSERFDGIGSASALRAFLLNRWMRTLPLYFLVLAIFAAHALALYPTQWTSHPTSFVSLWRFIFFSQDFFVGRSDSQSYFSFFIVSWSLCIEEWFYLLFPLIAFAAGRWRRSFAFWATIGVGLIAFSIGSRCYIYWQVDPGTFLQNDYYRRATFLRLDVFVYGAAVYFAVRYMKPSKFVCLMTSMAGLTILSLCVLLSAEDVNSFFCKVWLLSVVPFSCALLIPSLLLLRPPKHLEAPISFVSTRTYALYLTHMLVPAFWFIWKPITLTNYLAAVVIAVLLADVFHVLIERPIMNMRPQFKRPCSDGVSPPPLCEQRVADQAPLVL